MPTGGAVFWIVIAVYVGLISVFLYALLRSLLPRLQGTNRHREIAPRVETPPQKEAAPQRQAAPPDATPDPELLTVRSPWVEAYVHIFLTLAAIGLPVIPLVLFGYLAPIYFAISIAAILCEMLLWLYCQVNKLVITRTRVTQHKGFPLVTTVTIPITDIDSLGVSTSPFEERLALGTLHVRSRAHPNDTIRMTRIQDPTKVQAFIQGLRGK